MDGVKCGISQSVTIMTVCLNIKHQTIEKVDYNDVITQSAWRVKKKKEPACAVRLLRIMLKLPRLTAATPCMKIC